MNTPPFPDKKYDIIYADPAWKYVMGGNKKPENHYDTMTPDKIAKLPVNKISKDNSVLYLWTTMIHLDTGLSIMKSWGFTYKTNRVWDKQVIGTGYWFRGQHEHLLLGTKGNGMCPSENQCSSVLSVKRGQHSSKPLQVKRMIEQYHPNTDKIELFARPLPLLATQDDGWDYWGNEV